MILKTKLFKFLGYKIYPAAGKIVFKYSIEFRSQRPIHFSENIILPKKTSSLKQKNIHKFLEPLSLILGISYYKLYCPPKIVTFFKLSKEEAGFWNLVYRKGLGEFLYKNKLDPKKLARFPYVNKKTTTFRTGANEKILLGIGGGKDSIVALELLKNLKVSLFSVENMRPNSISQSVIKESGLQSFKIRRIVDRKIIKLEGAYRGHIPISAVYAFLGILSAFLYRYKYVVVGNEYSSNFGNVKYKGETVNHQWSKSQEFETLFQDYIRQYITPDITYFSLLRPFHEIRIAKMFAKYENKHKKYLPLFCSCNMSFRVFEKRPKPIWCGKCPKCAFVYIILAPFFGKSELIKIFGKNLFADKSLLTLFKDLLGFGKMKPFDCVGTFEESRAALYLASKKFKNDLIVKTFLSKIKNPKRLVQKVFKTFQAPTLPAPFKLLGIDNVCILGYGREGKVTEKYLKKKYPDLKIRILDRDLDKNYLERQKECHFAIKTPGISKNKVCIPYTTATNLFFAENDQNQNNKNLTIGVTGSKGKSTTASLIYEILKRAGRKVRLLGNIGNPMLGALLTPTTPDEIFVIELSSYMLDDIQYSPNIAVLLNLFPEHMDYHGGVKEYYQAKKNIFKFVKPGDITLCSPFVAHIPLQKNEIPLPGKHNLQNVKAAIQVAKFFKVSDKIIREAILNFKTLPHRLEYVGEFKGIKFYDDAISTTPESAIVAIRALPKTSTIFLGGEDRGYNFSKLGEILRKKNIKNIVLFPQSGRRILKSKKGLKVLETNSMEKAVKFAFKHTPRGRVCLLSTASPSYSLWKNFEEKGDLFKHFVKKYGRA